MRKQSKQNWTLKEAEKICRTPIKRGDRGDCLQSQERKISICVGVEIPRCKNKRMFFAFTEKISGQKS